MMSAYHGMIAAYALMMIAYQPAIAAGAANISQGWPFSPADAAMINLY
jgi:hypothetical protein